MYLSLAFFMLIGWFDDIVQKIYFVICIFYMLGIVVICSLDILVLGIVDFKQFYE